MSEATKDGPGIAPQLFESHKTVEAYKIVSVMPTNDGGKLSLEKRDGSTLRVKVSHAYMLKHEPRAGGYYVKYVDGYESFSPAKAFEDGYTLLEDKSNVQYSHLDACVYPSRNKTIAVAPDEDYGGAHEYLFLNCLGFSDGQTQYDESTQKIQFVKKEQDGTMVPGIQSEQLVLALIDRHEKLNAKFPSKQNEKALKGLKMFLDACKERVDDRIKRGVMGDLKK